MKATESFLFSTAWNIWFHAKWLSTGELLSLYPTVARSDALIRYNHDPNDPDNIRLNTALTMVFHGQVPHIGLASTATPFELKTRELLWRVQPGFPMTYGAAAEKLGSKGAARAIGQACARNKFAVLVPCHRIVGSSGLGGYRWGLSLKQELLAKERDANQPSLTLSPPSNASSSSNPIF